MSKYLKLIRVNNWVKNGLIALAFIFTPSLWLPNNLLILFATIALWSLLASSGYIINDILDLQNDRKHPIKKRRPIASGDVPLSHAISIGILFLLVAMIGGYVIHQSLLYVMLVYFILNTAYSIILKTIRFLDILILASFFMLRIIVGATLFDINISTWFFVTSFFGFLAVSLKKREMETYNILSGKIMRRGYKATDSFMLSIASYVAAFASIVFLNLHTIISLKVNNILALLLVNVLALYLVFSFMDKEHIKEDPVQTFLSKPALMLSVVVMLGIYVYLIYTSLNH